MRFILIFLFAIATACPMTTYAITYPPACAVAHLAVPISGEDYAYIVRPDPRWTVADVYATTPVTATNGVVSATIDLVTPWLIRWPPYQTTLHARTPYTTYTCRADARPSVAYVALIAH